jgi:hypothetical protein
MVFLIFLFIGREALPIFLGTMNSAATQEVIPVDQLETMKPERLRAYLGLSEKEFKDMDQATRRAITEVERRKIEQTLKESAGNRGKADSASPVALLMVVTLSFLIFYPAGWTALQVGQHTIGSLGEAPAIAAWLAVQYAVDFVLVMLLARLFQHFEVSRDS